MSTFDLFSSYNEENQDKIPVRRDSARKSSRSTDKKRKRGRSKDTSKENVASNDEDLITSELENSATPVNQASEKKKQKDNSKPIDVFELFDNTQSPSQVVEQEEIISEQKTTSTKIDEELTESETTLLEIESEQQEELIEAVEEQEEFDISPEIAQNDEERIAPVNEIEEDVVQDSESETNENTTTSIENSVTTATEIKNPIESTVDLELKDEVEEFVNPEINELSETVNQLIHLVQPDITKKESSKWESIESSKLESNLENKESSPLENESESPSEKEEKSLADSPIKPFISLKRTLAIKDEAAVKAEETEQKEELAKPFMSLKRSVPKPVEEQKVSESQTENTEINTHLNKSILSEELELETENIVEADAISDSEDYNVHQNNEEFEEETSKSSELLIDEIIDEIAEEENFRDETPENQQLVEDELAHDRSDSLSEFTVLDESELDENKALEEFSDEIGLSKLSKTIEKPISFNFEDTVQEKIEQTVAIVDNQEKAEEKVHAEIHVEEERESILESEIGDGNEEDSQENQGTAIETETDIELENISEPVEEKKLVIEEVKEEKPKKRSFFNLNKILSKTEIKQEAESTTDFLSTKLESEVEKEEKAESRVEEEQAFEKEYQEETFPDLSIKEDVDFVTDNVIEESVNVNQKAKAPIEIQAESGLISEQEANKKDEKEVTELEEKKVQEVVDSDELKTVVLPTLGSLKTRLQPARSRRIGFQMPVLPKRISEKLEEVEEQSPKIEEEVGQNDSQTPFNKVESQNITPIGQQEVSLPSREPVIQESIETQEVALSSQLPIDEVDDSLIDELITEESRFVEPFSNEVKREQNETKGKVIKEVELNEDNDFLDDLIHDVIEDNPILKKVQLAENKIELEDVPLGKTSINSYEEEVAQIDELEQESEDTILNDALFETLVGNDFTFEDFDNTEDEEAQKEAKVEDDIELEDKDEWVEEENDFQLGDVDFTDLFDQLIEDVLDEDSESPPNLNVLDDLVPNKIKQKDDSALKKNQSLQGAIHLVDESISALNNLEKGFAEELAEEETGDSSEISNDKIIGNELTVESKLQLRDDSTEEKKAVQDAEPLELDKMLGSSIDSEEIDPVHDALFGTHSSNKEFEQVEEKEFENDLVIESKPEKESQAETKDDIFGMNKAIYHHEEHELEEIEHDSGLIDESLNEIKNSIVVENEALEEKNANEDPVIAAKVSDNTTEIDDDVLDQILHFSQDKEEYIDSISEKNENESSRETYKESDILGKEDDSLISNELNGIDETVEEQTSEETESNSEIEIEEPDWYLEILEGMNKPSQEKKDASADSELIDSENLKNDNENLAQNTNEISEKEIEEVLETNESEKTASTWTPERESKIPIYVSKDSVDKENELKKKQARGKFKKQQEESAAVNANGDQMPLPDFDPLAIYKGMVRRWFIINRHTIGLFIGGLIAFRNALPKSRTKGLKFGLTRMAAFVLKIFVAKDLRDKSFAVQLRRRLELMGPTYIKLGQILALREDILPPVVTEELKNLLDRLPQIPFADIRGIVEAELGMKLEECFKDVNRSPIGTASIAQTHFATTIDDEKVVLKVVKPGIRDSILTDIRLLKLISGFLQWAIPQYQPKMLIDEFCVYTEKEVDLTNEADHAEIFAANFTELKGVRFPKIYREYSGQDVLCMEFMAGYKPGHEKMYELSIEDREYLVDRGAASIIQMLYKDGFFHADLHPGNLMIMEGPELGFIDLGMVGRFEDKTRRRMLYYFHALVTGDIDGATKYLLAMAKIGDGGDPQGFRRAVADVLRRYYMHSQNGDFSLGKLILNSLSIGGKYRVFFPVEMTLMVKALVTFEGVGYMLVPKLDIPALSEKYVSKIFKDQFNPKAITQELMRGAPELVDMLVQLPKISADGLKFLEEFMNDRSPSNPLEGVKGAIIAGALLVGGVISLVQGSHFGVYTTLFALSALFAMFGK
ncbi:MAG: hypothetical protein GW809_05750 [Bacteroidetes bacterium]|nr:hypothetical protein [Bacteroidota bacterium]NCQ11639.1 hypothetical protein [Bacteroidota bacterium]